MEVLAQIQGGTHSALYRCYSAAPTGLGLLLIRIVTKRRRRRPRGCSTQRAGIAPLHTEGDGLSGVTSDRELNAFNSVPASFVGGVPLTRAMNPWAMPEAST